MATLSEDCFDRKVRDADDAAAAYEAPVIRAVMNRSDWLTLIALAVIWGAAFLFISVAVHEVAPLTYVWLRLLLAAGAMWLFLWWRGEPSGLPSRVWGSILVLALFNNAIPFVLFGWGQTHIASGLASILNATTPIWGVVVAHLFTHDEKLSGRKLAGVLLGFAGVTVMIGPALLGSLGNNVLAQIACVTAALCYAFAGVWARRFRKMGLSPISVTTGQLTAGALVMMPLAILIDRPWLDALPSLKAIGAIAALAVVCSAFAYILYFRLIDRAGATNALLVTLLVPPVAIFLGSLVLNEVIEPRDFVGLALIALGLGAIDGRMLRAFSPRPARQAA
ncbi:MAG TPA: EamA family transporter [Sphingomicrobium sp.]|nr:EamA family transporter [Sphingomicrobium sp.]